jgi:hypothetical protein
MIFDSAALLMGFKPNPIIIRVIEPVYIGGTYRPT